LMISTQFLDVMISKEEIREIFNNPDPVFLENLASKAKKITQQYFGRTISIYAPLYLSNYCSSYCTYCGFHNQNKIRRFKLTIDQMHQEMKCVANFGIENILLLTGESYQATPFDYLKDAVKIAQKYFSSICLEVHPLEEDEYKQLFQIGVDGLTIYQETYDRERYAQVHLSGKKADYDYRVNTPQRAARAGIRNISLGILLGLGDLLNDLFSLYKHLKSLEKSFPGVEYSISFPRLQPIKGKDFAVCRVDDIAFMKVICLTRILFPRVGINLSTRENAKLRDHLIELGVTKISAGSNTSVGGYTLKDDNNQDPQFDVDDNRTVEEIIKVLKKRNFDPVLTDWRRIENI